MRIRHIPSLRGTKQTVIAGLTRNPLYGRLYLRLRIKPAMTAGRWIASFLAMTASDASFPRNYAVHGYVFRAANDRRISMKQILN
ncbi:MAG: hypothetical protein LBT42_04845 [Tannerella sp.]|nr:hypothetical protein [Tannerella sp.]